MSPASTSGAAPAAAGGGDLERLYASHAASCYGLAVRVTGDSEAAADVVAEVFTDVSGSPDAFASPTAACPVALLTLTHRKACAAARDLRRLSAHLPAEADGRQIPLALPRMPTADVEVDIEMVSLAYFRAYTQAEIAAAMGLPLREVRVRTLNAMRSLRGDQADATSATSAARQSRVRPTRVRVARPRRP